MHMKFTRILALAAVVFSAAITEAAPTPRWSIETLGNLGGGGTIAFGVNNKGDIVGYSHTASSDIRAFLWQNGTMIDAGVGTNPHFGSALWAINERGVAVGTANGEQMTWKDGAWSPVGVEGGAADINKFGDVAGSRFNGNSTRGYAVINGVMHQIPSLGPASEISLGSSGNAINDKGVVVGGAQVTWGVTHAYSWQNGVMTDLGTLGGNVGVAADINSRGVIVGQSSDATGLRAFIYDGVMRPLCNLPVGSDAQAINDRGAVVGNVGSFTAYLCDDGVVTILNEIPEVQAAGWRQIFPFDINDRGWIVGWGFKAGGSPNGEAFVLKPR
jgi:probable HAF family extracellular repeat protein